MISNLPQELQNKIFYFLEHPCAEMIKENQKEPREEPYKYRKYKPVQYDNIMSMVLLLVCRHSFLSISRVLELLDDEIDNFTEYDKILMYFDLLKYVDDKDGLLHWITNGENLQQRFVITMFPNIDNYDDNDVNHYDIVDSDIEDNNDVNHDDIVDSDTEYDTEDEDEDDTEDEDDSEP